jgi:peptidoglycan L-alanyl-D-glutamate endopeptidase CwlK
MNDVIQWWDNSIITGHRNKEDQEDAFRRGTTKLHWPHGNHNKYPSMAVDVAPYHIRYGALIGTKADIEKIARDTGKSLAWAEAMLRETYCVQAGIVLSTARKYGMIFRWGGDWDKDNDFMDNNFDDLPHFERIQ